MNRFAVCVAILLSGAVAVADDWPQWQGPGRTAVSNERGLLKEWAKDGPPLAWKVTGIGGGDSAPSIADGRLFGMSNRGDDEVIWALSEKDGKELWVKRLGPAVSQRLPQSKEGPGCTPTVDGERLYVLGMGGELACLRVKDGEVLWRRSLTRDFGGRVPTWSYRESPLVDGEKVICTPGGSDAMLAALDKLTGKTIWKSQVPGSTDSGAAAPGRGPGRGRGGFSSSGAAYASVIAITFEGQRQYVQLTARALVGVAASDGKFLWRYAAPANRMGINCSTPLSDGVTVFAASAYGAGGGLVKLTRDGTNGVKAEEVYFTNKMQNHHGGMVLHDGCLYGANGGNEGGNLVCLDFKTGEVLWNERARGGAGVRKGSVVFADGRLYYRVEDGTVLLIEPSRKGYVERGRFSQPDRSERPAWAHPVVANGKLYIRDQGVLLCYDVKAQ